jgi:MFS family permease
LAATVIKRANNNANGQVYAVFNLTYAAGSMVGPLVAGFLYEAFGFGVEVIVICGFLALYLFSVPFPPALVSLLILLLVLLRSLLAISHNCTKDSILL